MLNGQAPYDVLPTYVFYKYNSDNETIDKTSINWYVDQGSADIAGYTKVNWLSTQSASNKTLYSDRVDLFSSGLTASGVQNRHLYPFASSTIAESQGTLKNAYGF
jgi:hypothetical protein